MEVGHSLAEYTELFSDPPGKFKQSPYKGPTVIIWGFSTLVVTLRWTVNFFVGPAGKYGLSTGTSSDHVRHALVSLQCFLCFWWTGTKIHFPFSSKFENGPRQWREEDGFLLHIWMHVFFPAFDISSTVVWVGKDIKGTTWSLQTGLTFCSGHYLFIHFFRS